MQEWYEENPDYSQYYQGDVIRDVPMPVWPTLFSESNQESWAILRILQGTRREQGPINRLPNFLEAKARGSVKDAFQNLYKEEHIMVACKLRNIIILTKACELDKKNRKLLIVAPVIAFEELPEAERTPEILSAIRSGNFSHKFYLPPKEGLDESFADLLKLTNLHRSFLPNNLVRDILVARLTSEIQSKLQMNLSEYFGQRFGFDRHNKVPQTGYYSCSFCFYAGNNITRTLKYAGDLFGACTECGESACYIKLGNN